MEDRRNRSEKRKFSWSNVDQEEEEKGFPLEEQEARVPLKRLRKIVLEEEEEEEEEEPKMEEEEEEEKREQKHENCLLRSETPLKPWQSRAARFFLPQESPLPGQKGIFLEYPPQSGKTLAAIAATQCFLDRFPEQGRVVILASRKDEPAWAKGFQMYGAGLSHGKNYVRGHNQSWTMTKEAFAKWLESHDCKAPLMLVVDDAHQLHTQIVWDKDQIPGIGKPKKGVSSWPAINCARDAANVLLMSATPILTHPADLANPLAMLSGQLPLPKAEFKNMDQKRWQTLTRCKFARLTPEEEELLHIEHPVIHTLRLQMTPAYYRKYFLLESQIRATLFGKLLAKYHDPNKAMALALEDSKEFWKGWQSSEEAVQLLAETEADETVQQVLELLRTGRRTVVIANQRHPGLLEAIAARLDPENYVLITRYPPSTKEQRRNLRRFNQGSRQVLLTTSVVEEGDQRLENVEQVILLDPRLQVPSVVSPLQVYVFLHVKPQDQGIRTLVQDDARHSKEWNELDHKFASSFEHYVAFCKQQGYACGWPSDTKSVDEHQWKQQQQHQQMIQTFRNWVPEVWGDPECEKPAVVLPVAISAAAESKKLPQLLQMQQQQEEELARWSLEKERKRAAIPVLTRPPAPAPSRENKELEQAIRNSLRMEQMRREQEEEKELRAILQGQEQQRLQPAPAPARSVQLSRLEQDRARRLEAALKRLSKT